MAFKLKPILKAGEVSAAASINQSDLSTEFAEHSGNVYYYAAKHGEAARQEMKAKQNLELIAARIDKSERELAAAAKEKVTENIISNRVKADAEYQKAYNLYVDAVYIHSLAKGASIAMSTKRDMLIQLGASEREELKGNLRMRESPADRINSALSGVAKNA